jgi:pyruvate kinase
MIQKPQAIDRLAEILEVSDALMVARGDLGVELPLERVPSLQKQMTRMARRAGKPVVVATQMLESMIQSPVPTRAEVSDVATAVYEGADAIMLSAESAAGKFPVEAVSTMNRIGEEVERDLLSCRPLSFHHHRPNPTLRNDPQRQAAHQTIRSERDSVPLTVSPRRSCYCSRHDRSQTLRRARRLACARHHGWLGARCCARPRGDETRRPWIPVCIRSRLLDARKARAGDC